MVNKLKDETTIVWANTALAGQAQTVRFPRNRAIRSLFFFHDIPLDNDGIQEVLSGLEVVDTINIEWGGTTLPNYQEPAHEINVRGHEIAVTQKAHFGDTPLVGHASYRDIPIADAQDFDAVYRLPVGASPSPQQNIAIRVNLAGEVEWVETVASTPADVDSILYIVADYVDVLALAWDTWDDTHLGVAAQYEMQPPAKGYTIFGFSLVALTDEDDMAANGQADTTNSQQANYEDTVTTVEVEIGEEFISLMNGTPIINRIRDGIMRRHWSVSAGVIHPTDCVDMAGCYWFDLNVLANSLPRIRLNGAHDQLTNVWYSTPVLAAPTAQAVQGAGTLAGEGRGVAGQAAASVATGAIYQPAGQTSFQPPPAMVAPAAGGMAAMQGSVRRFMSTEGI